MNNKESALLLISSNPLPKWTKESKCTDFPLVWNVVNGRGRSVEMLIQTNRKNCLISWFISKEVPRSWSAASDRRSECCLKVILPPNSTCYLKLTSKMLEIHNYKLFLDKGIVDFDWNSLVHTTKFGSCGFASALYRSNWHILVSHYRPRNLKLKDVPGFPSYRLFSLKFLNRSLITALPWTRWNYT